MLTLLSLKLFQLSLNKLKSLVAGMYNAKINKQQRTTLRILDNTAFSAVKKKLKHYALELCMLEWFATKRMLDDIEERKEEEFEFDPDKGCTFGCELLARYCLPCRHWMYDNVVEETPLPLSLFYLRWHLNGLAVLYHCWVMTYDPKLETAVGLVAFVRYVGDRYIARRLQLAEESALAVLEKLCSLPPGIAESFANPFAKGTESLLAQQNKQF